MPVNHVVLGKSAIGRAIEQWHEFVFDHDMVSGARHRPTTAIAGKQTNLGVCGSESCPVVHCRLEAAAGPGCNANLASSREIP